MQVLYPGICFACGNIVFALILYFVSCRNMTVLIWKALENDGIAVGGDGHSSMAAWRRGFMASIDLMAAQEIRTKAGVLQLDQTTSNAVSVCVCFCYCYICIYICVCVFDCVCACVV